MEQNFDIKIYISLLRRRFFHIVIPAGIIFIIAGIIAYKLPTVYQSTATILVESQQIPADLARSTVTGGAGERIKIIEQRLMTRENLLEIARKFRLYASSNGRTLSPTEKVALMREGARISQLGTGGRRGQGRVIAFTVSFKYESPTIAARVANEFASRILEQNVQSRTDRASQTHVFFQRLVNQLEGEMSDLSAQIIAFKRENKDTLPETLNLRREQLSRLNEDLGNTAQKLAEASEKLDLLHQRGSGVDLANGTIAQQLKQLDDKLFQLRAFYTDSHPSVSRVLLQIKALEGRSAEQNEPKSADLETEGETTGSISSLRPTAEATLLERQIKKLSDRRARLEIRIKALEESIEKTPETGLAIGALTTQLSNARTEYRGVIAKRVEAETGERLEEDRQSERFEIIDQATPASEPIEPDRQKLIVAGFFGSGAVGVGFAILLELLNSSIRTSGDLVRQVHIKPIVSIPYIATTAERRNRWARWIALACAGVAILAIGLAAVHYYYQPLDILAYTLRQKAGL